jgi:hypothetical protein
LHVCSQMASILQCVQFNVQRSSRVGSRAFGISGPSRWFKPGLSALSATIQAMSGLESQICESTGMTQIEREAGHAKVCIKSTLEIESRVLTES